MDRRIPSKFLTSQPATANRNIAHQYGFQKDIRIRNLCNRDAYVIVSPGVIINIKSLGVGEGNIEFERQGELKSEEMLICAGDISKFKLHATDVYISVFIEVKKGVWQQWRLNRLVDSTKNDYDIREDAPDKCIDKHSFNLCKQRD
jgi:hypothetical protein|tara:strand:- start:1106 stop:1543 length:438 start_codon:yes stop_codon:yes gene_type:complete